MEIEIIKADKSHTAIIHEITQSAFKKYAENLGIPEKVEALRENEEIIEKDLNKKTILLAISNGRPAGTIRYEILPNQIAYISRFGVDPQFHNTGVGRALMLEVEAQVKVRGIKAIILHTASKMASLIQFYYGIGYYIYSTSSEKGYVRALLCKDLVHGHGVRVDKLKS